jgi:Domain of unknown function (DUF4112)
MKDKGLRIQLLRRWARMLDSAFRVPGTQFRVGIDPLIGLVPGIGDLVSPIFGVLIIWHAASLRVPKVVLARMVINAVVDGVAGAVPIVGDALDFFWRANEWNMALLERHAVPGRPATSGDLLFVIVCVLVVVLAAVVPLVVGIAVFYWAGRQLRGVPLF